MKVKYVGFGGLGDVPCYEDENGKLYFDENNGKGCLNLYTGAYRDECGEIIGEPNRKVEGKVECTEPFKRHVREHDYRMLSRLQSDCEYYLGFGNGHTDRLYYKDEVIHCDKMKDLYTSFSSEDKPQWITLEQIADYKNKMLKKVDSRIGKLVNSLSFTEKDVLYRILWSEHVKEDVESYCEEQDVSLTEDQLTHVVDLFVCSGRYDCNLSYWDNLHNLIDEVQ